MIRKTLCLKDPFNPVWQAWVTPTKLIVATFQRHGQRRVLIYCTDRKNPSEYLLVHEEIREHCMNRYLWVNHHRLIPSYRLAGFPLNAMAPPFLRSFKKIYFDRQSKILLDKNPHFRNG
jgi:hypothetical protein